MDVADLWILRIEHDYYRSGVTPGFDVQIQTEMRALLVRRNLIWRRKSMNEWCLNSFGDIQVNDADILVLALIAQGNELQFVTDFTFPVNGNCYDVEIPVGSTKVDAKECMNKKGSTRTQFCAMKLSVPVGEISNGKVIPATTILSFKAVCKYWEYLFIPRQENQKRILKLEDAKKTTSFGEMEQINFMGHEAYKIRSLDKLPLRDFYENIDLILWEIFPPGDSKRLLLRGLPFPEPTLNLGLSPDAVWRILYF